MAPMKAMKVMKAKAVRAMPKSGIAAQVAESTGLKKSEVTQVLSNLADIGAAEVKKNGKFVLPGLCMIKTRKKAATKPGKRVMFGKEVVVKAKPATTIVKALLAEKVFEYLA